MPQGKLVCSKFAGTGWIRPLDGGVAVSALPSIVNQAADPAIGAQGFLVDVAEFDTLVLAPFGAGANNSTFTMSLVGWSFLSNVSVDGRPGIWKPVTLASFTCTLGESVGVPGTMQGATERDADTIAAGTVVVPDNFITIVSPGSDLRGIVTINPMDFQRIGVYFGTGGSATYANAFFRWAHRSHGTIESGA